MRRIARGRQLRIQLGENKGDKYANRWERKRIMCPNKHLERRTARERERKREEKGTSWREQGGQARRQTEDKEQTVPRKHPERTATCESEVERRVRKQMGLESCPQSHQNEEH